MTVFTFKQFDVKQSDAAMKVGTDSVLLGSLLVSNSPQNILDIGTGTGLLALMMAQRFAQAQIDAVEIEEDAFQEAKYNFSMSKWKERLHIMNQSFQAFCKVSQKYDLIVSNPPYYESENHFSIPIEQRSKARHNGALSFEDLLNGINQLLSNKGLCWMILPVKEFDLVKQKALANGLAVVHQIFIHPKVGKDFNRIVFCLSKLEVALKQQQFFIYDEKGVYTKQYKELTMPFLLWKSKDL
jgi:tRNA1Val (adenine37-N6)-methyltransferase